MKKIIYANGVILIFWQIMHMTIQSAIIPSPWGTFVNFILIFPTILLPHLLVSLGRIITAIMISLVLGVAIGVWIGVNKRADALITPIVYILYPLPKIAFLPVLMILFGLGNTPKIILIILIIVFQIILAVRDGVREIPESLRMSVQSLGLTHLQVHRHLILPAILPQVFTALRVSIGVSIAVLFYGENFATTYGIGYFIMNSWSMINYLEMFSGIFALGLLGTILFKLIDIGENRLCNKSER